MMSQENAAHEEGDLVNVSLAAHIGNAVMEWAANPSALEPPGGYEIPRVWFRNAAILAAALSDDVARRLGESGTAPIDIDRLRRYLYTGK